MTAMRKKAKGKHISVAILPEIEHLDTITVPHTFFFFCSLNAALFLCAFLPECVRLLWLSALRPV